MRDIMSKFWSRTKLDEATGCLVWQGVPCNGYGRFNTTEGIFYAHRYAYERTVGPIPEGLILDHFVCSNKMCVNPQHVRPVTHRENILRESKTAYPLACPKGHQYDEANTYRRKSGSPVCRTCRREGMRERKMVSCMVHPPVQDHR